MGTWIFTKRKALGLSQQAVAAALGVSRPTYIAIERGERKPTPQERLILADLLNVSTESVETETKRGAVTVPDLAVREVPKEHVEKFKQTLLYILNKVGSRPNIGQTALYKLLYFIDFDYYEKYEKPLIGAKYIRNTYGPTQVSFVKIIKDMEGAGQLVTVKSKRFAYDQTKYVPAVNPDVSVFNGQELQHIDDEITRLAHLSARELSDLSHIDTPWRAAGEKQSLNYEHVFYRPTETTVRTYEPL